jgi:hypothetical protein
MGRPVRGMLALSVMSWCCGYDRGTGGTASAENGVELRTRLPAVALTRPSSRNAVPVADNLTSPAQEIRPNVKRAREDRSDAGGCDVPPSPVAGDGKRSKLHAAHTSAPSSGEHVDAVATWSSAWDSEGFDKVCVVHDRVVLHAFFAKYAQHK